MKPKPIRPGKKDGECGKIPEYLKRFIAKSTKDKRPTWRHEKRWQSKKIS